ncbi:hypothetical protein XU18_2012 [Perkinsela sp. CCAP 1560/4]|nr:hypothetical protein XU18_2012 [Perkinsela sp. CCAP 1560/4]|eukprot:KNH07480.1 hypothetical protein XU18_2012 [Perkinsela sp. CCAP 1560/4]
MTRLNKKTPKLAMGSDLKKALQAIRLYTSGKSESKQQSSSYDASADKFELFLTYNMPPADECEPTTVVLPHRKRQPDTAVCIFVADGKKEELKKLIAASPVFKDRSTKIIEIHKFRKDYDSLERRKQLRTNYSLFLMDSEVNRRVLLTLLGKVFLERHFELFPVQINTIESVEADFQKAMQSICINWKGKIMHNIQIGSMMHSADELYENAVAILQEGVLPKCPWSAIESIMVGELRYKTRLFVYAHDYLAEIKDLPTEDTDSIIPPKKKKGSATKRKV